MKDFNRHDNSGPHQIKVYCTEVDPNNSDVRLLHSHHQPDLSLIAHKPEPWIPQAKRGCHLLSSDFPKLPMMAYIHLKWHRASTDPSIQAKNGQLALLAEIWPRSVVKPCVRRFASSRSPPLGDKINLRAGCSRYLTLARFREPKVVTEADFRRKTWKTNSKTKQ